jgi:hypothetical protein
LLGIASNAAAVVGLQAAADGNKGKNGVGAQKKKGKPGPAGPTGPTGPAGPSGSSTVTTVENRADITTGEFSLTAECGPGLVAIGGGLRNAGPAKCVIWQSYKSGDRTWFVEGQCNGGVQLFAQAVCLE